MGTWGLKKKPTQKKNMSSPVLTRPHQLAISVGCFFCKFGGPIKVPSWLSINQLPGSSWGYAIGPKTSKVEEELGPEVQSQNDEIVW